MHRIALDTDADLLPDRTAGRRGRVGRPNQCAQIIHGVFLFKQHRDHRAGCHEFHQGVIKRPVLVHSIEPLRVVCRKVHQPQAHNPESRLLKARDDMPDQISLHRVRLDN